LTAIFTSFYDVCITQRGYLTSKLGNIHTVSIGPGMILWYDLSNGKGNEIWFFV